MMAVEQLALQPGWLGKQVASARRTVERPCGRLFIDMDGVLADFDKGYEKAFGMVLPPRNSGYDRDDLMWSKIHANPGFFRNLPLFPGAGQLWSFAKRQRAYVLTGCPEKRPEVGREKWQWARKNLGVDVPVITCSSKDKHLFCHPGDVLVDDYTKYKCLWEAKSGWWVTFVDAAQAIEDLRKLGYD